MGDSGGGNSVPFPERRPFMVLDTRFHHIGKDRDHLCDECGKPFHGRYTGQFKSAMQHGIITAALPAQAQRRSLWEARLWDATWLCVACWSSYLQQDVASTWAALGYTARREEKKRICAGLRASVCDDEDHTRRNHGQEQYTTPTPPRVHLRDERFNTPTEWMWIRCDSCDQWLQGTRSGSFISLRKKPITRFMLEAWRAGAWDATWYCANCLGGPKRFRNPRDGDPTYAAA